MKRKILSSILSLFLIISLTGCGDNGYTLQKYNPDVDYYSVDKEIVSENEKYQILWNDKTGEIKFKERQTGNIWTTASLEGSTVNTDPDRTINPQLRSPINIDYYDSETNKTETAFGYSGSLREGDFSAVKIENGIEVTYYFPKVEVSVSVEYTLCENGFSVTVDPKKITENTKRIFSVSLMPFICSVDNKMSSEEAYLFAPYGSGSLIYPKEIGDGVTSMISSQVYGNDKLGGTDFVTNNNEIKLPVYGAKVGNSALCAIITEGAENAVINTNIGSTTFGSSAIYASFNVRGGFYCESTYMQWYTSKQSLYASSPIDNNFSVLYCPLSGDDAGFMGMAKTYREYLKTEKGLETTKSEKLLNLKIIGGIEKTEFTAGVPHTELLAVTKFSDVKDMVLELNKATDEKMNVNLVGFSSSGISIGKIGGNFDYSAKYGSIKDMVILAEKNNIFFNFDILRFSENGSGISASNDAAITVAKQKNYLYENDIVSMNDNITSNKYLYVKRSELESLADKAINKVNKWSLTGVSLDTISYESYSDYRDNKFNAKSLMAEQTSNIIKNVNDSGLKFAATTANDYAAIGAEIIFDAPISSNKYQVYDIDIPFYELVFKGYVPMSIPALNLSENSKTAFLEAAKMGIGISYTLIEKYDTALLHSTQNLFFNSVYSELKEGIIDTVDGYKADFYSVAGCEIEDYVIHSKNLTETVFSNGSVVYVNKSDAEAEINGIKIPAEGYKLVKGGE